MSSPSAPSSPCTIHVDVLGSYFLSIRYAYTSCSLDVAHGVVERLIEKLGAKAHIVLYIDGEPAQEKGSTIAQRSKRRREALEATDGKLQELERRVNDGLRVRKRHFTDIKKGLRSAYYWELDVRRAFGTYMQERGWAVVHCPTEADLSIARACQSTDIVLSRDSDMLFYTGIRTIWRPISKGNILVYDLNKVMVMLGLNRTQLTVLGMVSANDYNRNIKYLGSATNYSIIKELEGQDPGTMLNSYLRHKQVVLRNTTEETFAASRKVFVELSQTILEPEPEPDASRILTYDNLQEQFRAVSQRYSQRETERPSEGRTEIMNLQGPAKVHNKYRTVVGPPGENGGRGRSVRPRYSAKTRRRRVVWPAPESMKRYKWKPHVPKPDAPSSQNPEDNKAKRKRKKRKITKTPTPVEDMTKQQLVRAMDREHPLVTLTVGTVEANAMRACGNDAAIGEEVARTLQEVTRIVQECKVQVQLLIGRFIQYISKQGRPPTEEERAILDVICPPLKNDNDGDRDEDENEDGDSDQDQVRFLSMLLRYVYSRERLTGTKLGRLASALVSRCPLPGATLQKTYPGGPMFDSTGRQMASEIKSHFKRGCLDIIEKLEIKVKRGLLAQEQLEIRYNETTISNFVRLNALLDNPRKVLPVSTAAPSFVSFSELELLPLFWKSDILRAKLLDMAGRQDMNRVFMTWWLAEQEPGRLTSELLTTIGRGRLGSGKQEINPTGYQRSTTVWSFEEVRAHLMTIKREGFDATEYTEKGYVLRGGISTDGFRLHLQAHKLKELQGVRFRRIVIPSRLTSTVGGTTDYLTEVRNVLKTADDVTRLWQCDPREIKIVGIDLGQSCVFGASALLPGSARAQTAQDSNKGHIFASTMPSAVSATPAISSATSAAIVDTLPSAHPLAIPSASIASSSSAVTIAKPASVSSSPPPSEPAPASDTTSSSDKELVTFHNMSVKSKAFYQPVFKFRRWLNEGKNVQPEGEQSIQDIETNMPTMRGESADFDELTTYISKHQSQLRAFYGRRYQKHTWDRRRAKEAEYAAAADQLLKMVGGTIGEKRKPDNHVLFGIGLGKFSSTSGLTSLHSSFESYLVSLRPSYLQPVDKQGSLIWKQSTSTNTGSSSGSGTSTSTSSSVLTRKRGASSQ
ncbi:hypothetical protein BGZ72_005819 [Mortierella alpina]|nr:hypothetical protein BGZ72_005819 [Mortierella alpina]